MKKKIMIGCISLVAVVVVVVGIVLLVNSNGGTKITTGTKALEYTVENFIPSAKKVGSYIAPFNGNLNDAKNLYYISTDFKMTSEDQNASLKADFAIRPNLKEIYFNGNLTSDSRYSNSNINNVMLYYDDENIYYKIEDSEVFKINIDYMKENLSIETQNLLKSNFEATRVLIEALSKIEDEDLERINDMLVKAINNTLKEDSFKESKTDIKLGNDSKEAVKWELDITQKLGVDLVVNFLKEFKKDKDLQNVIKEAALPFVNYYSEKSGSDDYEDFLKDLDIEAYIDELLENIPTDISEESLGKISMYAVNGELVRYKLTFKEDEEEIGIVYNTYENSKGLSNNEIQLLSNNVTAMIFKVEETSKNKYNVSLTSMGKELIGGTCINSSDEFSLNLTSELLNDFKLDYKRKVVRPNKEEKIDFNLSMEQYGETTKIESSSTIYTDKSVPKDVYANSKDVANLTEKEKEEFADYFEEILENQ